MKEIKRATKATNEEVDKFLKGSDPMERIIKIECGYEDTKATIIYRDANFKKHYVTQDYYPFCWAKQEAGRLMFGGDRNRLKLRMQDYGISCKGLTVANEEGYIPERMENGYRVLFYATRPMSHRDFSKFFDEAKVPLRPKERDSTYGKKLYISVAPNEQFMIATGKRLFKGYESYDDLLRFSFDLETEGLVPTKDAISQIGYRTNKGFEKIITIEGEGDEKKRNEMSAMREFFDDLGELDPDIVTGYNTENFDWNFYDVRSQVIENSSLAEVSKRKKLPQGCYKKTRQAILKLGGEIEKYFPTVMWGKHITDCLFSVRRAQALDSNMKKASLKYVTKYSKIAKKNRVYLPGKIINKTWADLDKRYAFNDENGDWYKTTDTKPIKEGYEFVTGRYIAERYLLDDIWETDKVELRYNESNFLVGKMLPVNFERMCTMGTATIWKYIMLAWSYEHNLAIPLETSSRSFTGGLSRLLTVGYIPNVLKLDYNSLYPSIILTFGIKTEVDISGAMPAMLEYVLTNREYYKALKGKYGKEAKNLGKEIELMIKDMFPDAEIKKMQQKQFEADGLSLRNDKMQLPLKITGNAFFGSFGSGGGIFYWSDIDCAEETTCCGRQMLRLMLKWFTDKGYQGIVCDSVTGDTPLFVKNNNTGFISIKTIEELFTSTTEKHNDGREYDRSKKDYKILCRSGWVEPKYFYRHETDKDTYRVNGTKLCVDVTKDHSLFDENKKEIKPTEITETTKLEYYNSNDIYSSFNTLNLTSSFIETSAKLINSGLIGYIDDNILNSTIQNKQYFLSLINKEVLSLETHSKKLIASIQYLQNSVLV